MRIISIIILLQISALVFSPLFAQPIFTGWLASFNTFKTGKKTSIHTDVQLRSTDEIKQVQTLLLRPGLNVHLNKSITVTAGYALIRNKLVVEKDAGFTSEHRIWEQLLVNHKMKNIFISHRFRMEQRFIPKILVSNFNWEPDGSAFANRFRYFLRNVVPLKNERTFTKGAFAALQNEVFVNLGNKSVVNNEFFDQNRFYIAAGYRLRSSFDLEAGYMNQYVNGRGKAFTNNHIVQLAGYLRL